MPPYRNQRQCNSKTNVAGMNLSRLKQRITLVLCRSRILAVLLLGLLCTLCLVSVSQNSLPFIEISTISTRTSQFTHTQIHADLEDLVARSTFDNSGKYRIISYVQTAQNWTHLAKAPLCTAVQASLDRMDLLPNFMRSWSGPLSIAVFAPGQEFYLALKFMQYLAHCYPAIRQQISLHAVFPIDKSPEAAPDIILNLNFDCNLNSSLVLQLLMDYRSSQTVEWRNKMQYPQNLLRNVAKSHCQTTYVTCIDIDMVFPHPSPQVQPSIMDQLNVFLTSENATSCNLCAFVLPIFELDYSVTNVPGNKTELLQLKTENKARQYHVEVFPPNQGLSRLNTKWSKLPPCEVIQIAYSISKFQFWYEPVYIAKRGAPEFDERYIGFGMVRNTQAYEMFLAGYTFHILDNVFLSHWGYQKRKTLSRERLQQTNANFKRFINQHVRELAVKYDQDPLNLIDKYGSKMKHPIVVKQLPTISPHLVHTGKPRRRRSLNAVNNRKSLRKINDLRLREKREYLKSRRKKYFSQNITIPPPNNG